VYLDIPSPEIYIIAFLTGLLIDTPLTVRYISMDDSVGDCFGVEVPGDADVSNCPADAYQPKD